MNAEPEPMSAGQHDEQRGREMTTIGGGKPNGHRLLLTVVEAADLLGVGRTTLYELLGRGELQAVRIGRSRRVPRQAIDDYVERLVNRARTRIDP